MPISTKQIKEFDQLGFLSIPGAFSTANVEVLTKNLAEISKTNHPGHILEAHGQSYRAFHGCHLYNEVFADLVNHPLLVNTSKQLLRDDVYLHQLKINNKSAFSGESWPWHQDFIYWHKEDGMPEANVLSVMIYLDDVTEFNGPLFFVPGSHQLGCIDVNPNPSSDPGWEGDVSAQLKYQVMNQLVKKEVDARGMYSAKGPAGTAVWFHGNLVHGSPPNMSPCSRRIAILTYNAVSNKPINQGQLRPEFLNARNREPLEGRLSNWFKK